MRDRGRGCGLSRFRGTSEMTFVGNKRFEPARLQKGNEKSREPDVIRRPIHLMYISIC